LSRKKLFSYRQTAQASSRTNSLSEESLGLEQDITRRDFLNSTLLASGGALLASFAAYALEKKVARPPRQFGHGDIRGGTKWIGADGWVWVDRGGFDASTIEWFQKIPDDKYKVKLYHSDNHQKNFVDCVKSRKPTITPVETAHHSALPGHLGLIAMLVGRKIRWDSAKEVIIGGEEASKLMTRGYRTPWNLV